MLPVVEPMQPSKLSKHCQSVLQSPYDFIYEHKFDGWRCLAYVEDGKVTLRSKNGKRLTRFSRIEVALQARGLDEVIFDGEIVSFNSGGDPDFFGISSMRSEACYVVFDMLWLKIPSCEAADLRQTSLSERKSLLRLALHDVSGCLRRLEHFEAGNAEVLIDSVRERHLEGVVAKRVNSRYDAKAEGAWVKICNADYIPTIIQRKKLFDRKA